MFSKMMIGGYFLPAILGIAFAVDISNGGFSSQPAIYLSGLVVCYGFMIFSKKVLGETTMLILIFATSFFLPIMIYTVGHWKETTPFLIVWLLRVAGVGMLWINSKILRGKTQ
jgi:hypothetical protein